MNMSLNLKVRTCKVAGNLFLPQPSVANGKILIWEVWNIPVW